MTIETGDLGSSLPIGGVIIGAMRVETDEFEWREVPVALFQGKNYATYEHYFAAADLTIAVLEALHAPTDEPICFSGEFGRREVLTRLQGAFSDVRRGSNPDRLRQKLAETLHEHLKTAYDCEIPLEILADKPGLAFYVGLERAKGGSPHKIASVSPEKEAFCKTGWPSWRIWADNLYPEAKKLAAALRETRQQAFEAGKPGSGGPVSAKPGAGKPDSGAGGPASAAVLRPGEWEEKYGDQGAPF